MHRVHIYADLSPVKLCEPALECEYRHTFIGDGPVTCGRKSLRNSGKRMEKIFDAGGGTT